MTLAVLVWLLMLAAAGVLLVMVLANLPHHKERCGASVPCGQGGAVMTEPNGQGRLGHRSSRFRHVAALSAYGVCDAYVKNRRKMQRRIR